MYKITVLPGDGIGPEICAPAVEVLATVAKKHGFEIVLDTALIGGIAIDKTGTPLPQDTIDKCKNSDAVLLGAVGGPKWDGREDGLRPEQGLLKIRKELGLFSNLRPAVVYNALKSASPLKSEIIGDKLDILVVRELTGGIYFGKSGSEERGGERYAFDTEEYSENEIQRIAKVAFNTAMKRGKRLTSVDKANVLESSRLWRTVVTEVAKGYPEVALSHMYVDNAAMQLIRQPRQFDVILTNNIFGDILSDAASQITGSIGMLPSASMGNAVGMYEPIHGSAPDIAGKNIANPLATILSVAMMLRYSFGLEAAAADIERAVETVINKGVRTADIALDKDVITGTKEIGEMVKAEI